MKCLLFVVFLLPGFAFAKRLPSYQVEYIADAGMSTTDTKVVIFCGQFEDAAPEDVFRYGANDFEGTLPTVVEQPLNVQLPAGRYIFQFYYWSKFEEIETDSIEVKPGVITKITLRFFYADEPVRMKKPVIYLYPETDTEVELTVGTANGLSFSYPAYADGWKGIAHPDGSMTIAGKTYPYLFWEADKTLPGQLTDRSEGFIVEREDVIAFLEAQLGSIGLTTQEQTDFITFWGPQLVQHERVYLRFAWNADITDLATLELSVPATINRLYLIWSAEIPGASLSSQQLPVFDRSGFDVLEWGGMELPARLTETASGRFR